MPRNDSPRYPGKRIETLVGQILQAAATGKA